MKKRNNKKGFTIIELVIVIAVIGILSAILIPTFSNLISRADYAALQSNMSNAYIEYTGSDEYLETKCTQKQVYMCATIIDENTDFKTVYEWREDKKYDKVDTETTASKYHIIRNTAYNGYYLYTYN